jgi:hypothetical protein
LFSQSLSLSVCPSVCPLINLSVGPSVRQSVRPSVGPSVHLSIHPSVCWSVRLLVCWSVRPLVSRSVGSLVRRFVGWSVGPSVRRLVRRLVNPLVGLCRTKIVTATTSADWSLPLEDALLTYHAMVEPIINYGFPLYAPIISDTWWSKLQIEQFFSVLLVDSENDLIF